MSEVDIEVSETEHTAAVSDINVALIPLFLVSFALTGGYCIFSLLTAHERDPIPSFVDFLELYDCDCNNWPPQICASECFATDDDDGSKSPVEQCPPSSSGIGCTCDGLMGLEIVQESVETGLPCELVVIAHTPCFPVRVAQTERPPIARFHHHRRVRHQWPKFKLKMPPALSQSQGRVMTVITASGGANKPFNVLVGSDHEPAYLNVTL
jgi:hypothetical protein